MNRYLKIFFTAVAASGLLASCSRGNVTPDLPGISKYEQLTFSTADDDAGKAATRAVWSDPNGKGNLIFNWETDETGTQMVALLSDGNGFIHSYPSEHPTEEELQEEVIYTFMTIRPQEDLHKADFTTVRYYDTEEMARATDIFVAAPLKATDNFYDDKIGFEVRMEMPATFTQTKSQNPEFLRDYMMVYGHATVENGNTSIQFKHIPATFRFIITNKRPDEATIESVSMTIDGDAPIGSRNAAVWGYHNDVDINLDCFEKHTSITTNLNAKLESQETYTAYAMALPLEYGATLEDKDVKFVINTVEHGFLSFVLTGAQIANANHGEYNWVGGKSYTIRMSLNDVLTFDGITVEDWNKETVEGGEAEEE